MFLCINCHFQSEDDGHGGRRKKGLKKHTKERLSGGKSREEHGQPGYEGQEHEKKGMMEKIKEKVPGLH